jgi:hypothetical protein
MNTVRHAAYEQIKGTAFNFQHLKMATFNGWWAWGVRELGLGNPKKKKKKKGKEKRIDLGMMAGLFFTTWFWGGCGGGGPGGQGGNFIAGLFGKKEMDLLLLLLFLVWSSQRLLDCCIFHSFQNAFWHIVEFEAYTYPSSSFSSISFS